MSYWPTNLWFFPKLWKKRLYLKFYNNVPKKSNFKISWKFNQRKSTRNFTTFSYKQLNFTGFPAFSKAAIHSVIHLSVKVHIHSPEVDSIQLGNQTGGHHCLISLLLNAHIWDNRAILCQLIEHRRKGKHGFLSFFGFRGYTSSLFKH